MEKERTEREEKKYRKKRREGKILYYLLRVIKWTLRVKTIKSDKIDDDKTYIFGVWHQKVSFAVLFLTYLKKKTSLVSPSRDGEVLEQVLKGFGYDVIRGSSRDGGVRALLKIVKMIKNGYTYGTALDGPMGPIFKVKPGAIYAASKTGVEIIPMGGAYKNKYVFEKAWDKFHFPMPFTKTVVVFGDPIKIPKDANPDDYLEIVNEAINSCSKVAEENL